MIGTIYSNSYEALRQVLFENIQAGRKKNRFSELDAFSAIDVVVPNDAVKDDLMRHISSAVGICAGIRFEQMGTWFSPYGGYWLGDGENGQELEWLIYRYLSDPAFVGAHPRLLDYLGKDGSPTRRYRLALKIAALFASYSTYRLDWILQWMGVNTTKIGIQDDRRVKKDREILAHHPDSRWQIDLWKKLAADNWSGLTKLKDLPNRFKSVAYVGSGTLHIFIPNSIPPLVLPFLKKFSDEIDIFVYLINPCVHYWFQDLPRDLFQGWSEKHVGNRYLLQNASSTRALIDRFWNFTGATQTAYSLYEEDFSRAPVAKSGKNHPFEEFDIARLENLQLDKKAEEHMIPVDFGTRTFLKRVQSSILTDENLLRDAPLDASFLLAKAPSRTREAQALVNWVLSIFEKSKEEGRPLKSDDILIVTPDIDSAASALTCAFQALPKDQRIDYRIVGESQTAGNTATRAILSAASLIYSALDRETLGKFLCEPLLTQNWNLTQEDVTVLAQWLRIAGFRHGLNDAHIRELVENKEILSEGEYCDGTLTRALERLLLGLSEEKDSDAVYLDTKITAGNEGNTYTRVYENEPLLQFIATLGQSFADLHDGREKTPFAWLDWFNRLVDRLFPLSKENTSVLFLLKLIRSVVESADQALHDTPISFELILQAIEVRLGHTGRSARSPGCVTVANMTDFRRLPFRAVAVIGLDEASSFPGKSLTEEFDLMKASFRGCTCARRGDRDSRSDNRNVFLDLMLSARDYFYASYSAGENPKNELNPSVVLQDLHGYLCELSQNDRLKETLPVRVPLTDVSVNNFKPEQGLLQSHSLSLCHAVQEAICSNYMADLPPFSRDTRLKQRIGEHGQNALSVDQLSGFYGWKHNRVVDAMIGLPLTYSRNESAEIELNPNDALTQYKRKTTILKALAEKKSPDEIKNLFRYDPLMGDTHVRTDRLDEEIETFSRGLQLLQAPGSELLEEPEKTLSLNGTLFKSLIVPSYRVLREDGKTVLCDMALSRSSKNALEFVFLALNAMGLEIGMRLLDLSGHAKDSPVTVYDPVEKDRAFGVIQSLVSILEKHLEAFDAYAYFSDRPGSEREPFNPVTRPSALEKLQAQSKALIDLKDKFIRNYVRGKECKKKDKTVQNRAASHDALLNLCQTILGERDVG